MDIDIASTVGISIIYYAEKYRKINDLFRVTEQSFNKSVSEVSLREDVSKDG